MGTLLQDLRYAVRVLRKNPGFTSVAVVSLALGIGANTAIFQLIDAVRLRTIPVKDPQQLALVQLADRTGWRGSQATPNPALTNHLWERFRDSQDVFSGVLAWGDNNFNLASGGEARLARGLFVSGDFFRVLGVQPVLGRVFTAADDRRGCGLPGAVVSYAFWQREFAGSPSAVGSRITLNYQPGEVIGITPASFSGLEVGRAFDVAVPICSQATLWSEGNWLDAGTVWWLTVMGRLQPGGTLEKTNARLRTLSPGIFEATLPSNYPAVNVRDYLHFKLAAVPAATGVSTLRSQYGDPLTVLWITSGLVLLIACANLANLMLARGTAREHEIAVRMAIGASRGGLIRQLTAEGLLLAVVGGGLGLVLSGMLSQLLVALLVTQGNPLFLDLDPNREVLAFTMALAGLTCILFGLVPAWRATRIPAAGAMRSGSRGLTASRERFGLRQMLVVSQVALSLVLLVGALLFSGSLRRLLTVDAGFRRSGVLIANMDYSRLRIPVARRVGFKSELLSRLRAIPGIDAAGEVGILPLSGGSTDNLAWADGADPGRKLDSSFNWIGQGYLRAMDMTLLAGRDFDDHDAVNAPRVAIVNQSFAQRMGLGSDPIGKRFHREATPTTPETVFEIVGLVRDTKYLSLRAGFPPIAYVCSAQDTEPDPFAQIVIRSALSAEAVASSVRKAVAEVSPAIVLESRTFESVVQESLLRERLMATLSIFFGLLAALIAAIGLCGVISYLVARRNNEIGIRIALGADQRGILALVLRQAGVLLAAGLTAGTALALVAARMAASLLFGLQPHDLPTFVLATAVLAAVAIAASYIPARRAAGVDPMTALRQE